MIRRAAYPQLHMILVAAFLAFAVAATGGTPVEITICFQLPSNGTDTGFNYINNLAQRQAAAKIRAQYPSTDLKLTNRVFFNQDAVMNMTAQMISMIEVDGCNAIMSCSRTLWSRLPNGQITSMGAMYPNVKFWIFSVAAMLNPSRPANAYASTIDMWSKWFVCGAAAAVECSSCVGFLIPMQYHSGLVTAFYRGMKFGQDFRSDGVNVTERCPLISAVQNTFSNPDGERAFARTMISRGCSIVAIFSDNADGARYIEQIGPTTPAGRPIFTITGNVNGPLVIGDSVLTSVVTNFEGFFYRFIQSMYLQTPIASKVEPDAATIGDISPLASSNASHAMDAAIAALGTNNSVLWCPPLYDQSNQLANPNGTCIPFSVYSTMTIVEMGVQKVQFQSPLSCPPGSFTKYNVFTDLSLNCTLCPVNTFSAAAGSPSCTPCPSGTEAPFSGSLSCKKILESDSEESPLLMAILLATLLPCFAAAIAVAVFLFFTSQSKVKEVPAPRDPLLAVCIVDVDPERSSSGWRDQILVAAYIFELFRSSVVEACRTNDAYIVSATPTTYILVARTPRQLVEVAETVQAALVKGHQEGSDEAVISIRAVVTFGKTTCRGGHSSRAVYSGPAIDKLLVMYQDPAVRTMLCVSDDVYAVLCDQDSSIVLRVKETFAVRPPPPPPAGGPSAENGGNAAVAAAPIVGSSAQALQAVRIVFRCEFGAPPRKFKQSPPRSPATAAGGQKKNEDSRKKTSAAAVASSELIPQAKMSVVHAMCSRTLCMFLNVLTPSRLEAVNRQLAQRFRILFPPAVENSDEDNEASSSSPTAARLNELRNICSCIVPSLVETMDDLQMREQLEAMAGPPNEWAPSPTAVSTAKKKST